MPSKRTIISRELRRGEYSALRGWFSIDPAEQTRATWAKHIASYDAVPQAYQDFFARFAGEKAFPYTILMPSYSGFIHSAAEKLICLVGHEFYILEEDGPTYQTYCYPLADIYYLETHSVLLDSYVTLRGKTKSGEIADVAMRFNSVGDVMMAPILEKIRRIACGLGEIGQDDAEPTSRTHSETHAFDAWEHSNYKFMNYARRSLLEGENVVHAILHPEIREKVITVLGKSFYRMIAPTQALIRTDYELIVIGEGKGKRQSGYSKYGGTWNYIPLNKIVTSFLTEVENDLATLSIQLPGETSLNYTFEASAVPEIQALLP
ncbi:MAG: hypothetical protein JXA21_29410 [Anaerolineae bacterium]|nr:hypothetical protein [Anaerolineae bacterium]